MRVCPYCGTEWSLIGSRGRRFSDLPLLVLTTAQEGIGMRSISITSGIFSLGFWFFYLLVMSLNMLGEALSKIIVLTGGSLITDGRVTQKFQKQKLSSNNSNDRN
jgi:uncharacterized membrane protein YcaP (DUF421 family)